MSTARHSRKSGNLRIAALRLLSTLVLGLSTTLAAADYQAGVDAYEAGRYTEALQQWQAVTGQPPATVGAHTYAETHYLIGMLYFLGKGVKQDYAEAFRWLKKGAELGSAGAQNKLGYMYSRGLAVPRNRDRAFVWFKRSAQQGDVDGQYNLGVFYLNGWGTEKDVTMAAQYLGSASAQGDERADKLLQKVLQKIASEKRSHGTEIPASAGMTNIPRHPGTASSGTRDLHGKPAGSNEIPASAGMTNRDAGITESSRRPRESGDLQKAPADSNEIPAATALTLQPASWILQRNPQHYTIQVIGLSKLSSLEDLVRGYSSLAPFATYTLWRNGKPLYLLLQGDYPDAATAQETASRFPKAIQKPENLWVRRFIKIQELIKADKISRHPGTASSTPSRHPGTASSGTRDLHGKPAGSNEIPASAGMTNRDAGMTNRDAGMTNRDAGMTNRDAGMTSHSYE